MEDDFEALLQLYAVENDEHEQFIATAMDAMQAERLDKLETLLAQHPRDDICPLWNAAVTHVWRGRGAQIDVIRMLINDRRGCDLVVPVNALLVAVRENATDLVQRMLPLMKTATLQHMLTWAWGDLAEAILTDARVKPTYTNIEKAIKDKRRCQTAKALLNDHRCTPKLWRHALFTAAREENDNVLRWVVDSGRVSLDTEVVLFALHNINEHLLDMLLEHDEVLNSPDFDIFVKNARCYKWPKFLRKFLFHPGTQHHPLTRVAWKAVCCTKDRALFDEFWQDPRVNVARDALLPALKSREEYFIKRVLAVDGVKPGAEELCWCIDHVFRAGFQLLLAHPHCDPTVNDNQVLKHAICDPFLDEFMVMLLDDPRVDPRTALNYYLYPEDALWVYGYRLEYVLRAMDKRGIPRLRIVRPK